VKKIVLYPNPILDKTSELVVFPLDEETKSDIKDMWEVVKADGVGLAAPQIGVSKQICIIHLSEVEKGKQAKDILLINPKIVFESSVENLMIEGCLSFPEQFYEIWRPANVNIEYFDEQGKKKLLKARDLIARVAQHEVDHLHGKLFIKKGGRKMDPSEFTENTVIAE
jgi:peptide deformylase